MWPQPWAWLIDAISAVNLLLLIQPRDSRRPRITYFSWRTTNVQRPARQSGRTFAVMSQTVRREAMGFEFLEIFLFPFFFLTLSISCGLFTGCDSSNILFGFMFLKNFLIQFDISMINSVIWIQIHLTKSNISRRWRTFPGLMLWPTSGLTHQHYRQQCTHKIHLKEHQTKLVTYSTNAAPKSFIPSGEMLFCRFCWQHVDQMEKKNEETNVLHVLYK